MPTLVGVLRPQIWLPRALPDTLTTLELRHVLFHELGHFHRRDLLAQWLCALACCLHWFNPLVWLLARLARTDRELACDAWVLSHDTMRTETAAAYGHTLLKIVAGMGHAASRAAIPVVSMAAGNRHLGLRVREIRAFRPVDSWRGVAALAVVAALVAAGTLRSAAAGPPTVAVTPSEPVTAAASPPAASSPAVSPAARVTSSPASSAPTPPVSETSPQFRQVEIESKFIEIAKSDALALEKSGAPSSPVKRVFTKSSLGSRRKHLRIHPRSFVPHLSLPMTSAC